MTQFSGASAHPLLAEWCSWYQSQEYTYAAEWQTLAGRGISLACNDPFIAALVNAAIQMTLGPTGLRLQSLFDSTPTERSVSAQDLQTRRTITAICEQSWYGHDLDAEGSRTRRELEATLLWMSWAIGEGFAIRSFKNGRSVWRIVMPDRICNPGRAGNIATIRDGFQLDSAGRIIGLWVTGTNYLNADPAKAVYVPWTASDGTPNVIHRKGFTLPGMVRGVTRLAPMIVLSRQLGSVLESHVAAKRLQAVHGMIVTANSPEEYKAAQATGDALDPFTFQVKGPLGIWVKHPDSSGEVEFPKVEFSGTDLAEYCQLMWKVQCAAVGMPVDVVLANMGAASLSSARAGLDQFDRLGQSEQEQHIAECTSVIDRAAISDRIATGELTIPVDSWPLIMAGKYSRPPRFSTDALKDANTVKTLIEAGFSKTTAFLKVGASFEDETELKASEAAFAAAHGIKEPAPTSGAGQPPSTASNTSAAPPPEDQNDQPPADTSTDQQGSDA